MRFWQGANARARNAEASMIAIARRRLLHRKRKQHLATDENL
jgi:hypothetical protein